MIFCNTINNLQNLQIATEKAIANVGRQTSINVFNNISQESNDDWK